MLGGNYNAPSGIPERTPVLGSANKQVLEDIRDPTGVTGQITFQSQLKYLNLVLIVEHGNLIEKLYRIIDKY